MRGIILVVGLASLLLAGGQAQDFQGMITDWNCTQAMVRNGREKTLRNNHNCSLARNFDRSAYGLITDDKKYYKLDDNGRRLALKLLKDSPVRDGLKVVVNGELAGDTIKVQTMSLL
jgi:hypothetical protein